MTTLHVFPNFETVLVTQLRKALAVWGHASIRVAVTKDQKKSKTAQIVIGDDGGILLNAALREHGFRLNIYGPSEQHETLDELASLVEALIPTLPASSGGALKFAEVNTSATRIQDPTGDELRNITGTATIRASKLST